ncbi:hypothetical protein B0J11DRAFT_542467 [Dendryphion nanum]|uniref:Uncharacterized protein n=1 Tax=Dendryphion nanum TaxID=256645 RepID=A0A9P9I980_9PLEO|nr:hypothetical protein B0J11DRAFT_542467 [Dendryphion nanum]
MALSFASHSISLLCFPIPGSFSSSSFSSSHIHTRVLFHTHAHSLSVSLSQSHSISRVTCNQPGRGWEGGMNGRATTTHTPVSCPARPPNGWATGSTLRPRCRRSLSAKYASNGVPGSKQWRLSTGLARSGFLQLCSSCSRHVDLPQTPAA